MLRNKDGSVVPVAVSSHLIFDKEGNPVKISGILRDITERKQAGEALRESSQKWKAIIAASPDGIGMASFDGKLQFASVKLAAMYGYTAEEIDEFIGKPIFDFIDSSCHQMMIDSVHQMYSGDIKQRMTVYRSIKKDGSRFYSELNSTVLYDSKGNPENILYVQRDITDRLKAEQILIKNEERLRRINEISKEVVWEVDATGLYTFVSPLSATVWGYSPEQLIGKLHFYDLYPEENREKLKKDAFKAFALKTQFKKYLNPIVTRDGKDIWVETNGIPVSDDQGNLLGYLGSDSDVTQRKFAEDEMVKFRNISDTANSGNVITSMDGTLLYVNNAFAQMHGWIANDLLGKNLMIVHNNEQLTKTKELLEKLKNKGGFSAEEVGHVRKDGSAFQTLMNASVMYDDNKVAQFMSSTTIDITEKKQAENEVHNLNVNLENKIKERTAQLAETNANLLHEIAERSKVEENLAIEKRRLADIIEGTDVGTWEWNIQTGATIFNERWAEIIGYTLDELSPVSIATWEKFAHPDDLKQAGEVLEKHFHRELAYYSSELRMKHKNGDWVWVLDKGKVHGWDQDGKPVRMSGTHQDISAQKQSEQIIEQTRRNYETFFNTIDDFLFVLDEQGNMIHTNSTVTKRLGYTTDELLEKSVLMVHPAERRAEAGRIVGEMLEGTAEFCPVPLITKSGNYIPVETRVKPGFWNGKSVIFGVSKDVSQIKLSEEKFSKAFHSNSALMAISDEDGCFIDVNDSFVDTLGYTRNEIIGKTSIELDLFIKPNVRDEMYGLLKQNNQLKEVETEIRTKSGKIVLGLFSGDFIYLGSKRSLLTMVVDITERKQAEVALIAARNEADRANLAKSEFLSRMSHELRTPMNSILGFAQLMEMGELKASHKKGVNHIINSGKHLLSLINEVLDISGIESGRQILTLEPVLLSGIINDMMDVIQVSANKRNITIELVDIPANNFFVIADKLRLKQVLLNLTGNAIKYNREGGSVWIKTGLQPADTLGNAMVRISISDSGYGIKQEDISKLFQPFERIGADKTETEGNGLGLMVVKNLMKAMDGAVGVESEVGIGTTFWIELPFAENKKSYKQQHEENRELSLDISAAKKEINFLNEEKTKRADELKEANTELAFQNKEKADRAAELIVTNSELVFQIEENIKLTTELAIANNELSHPNKNELLVGSTNLEKTGTILYIEDNASNTELMEQIMHNHRSTVHLVCSKWGALAVPLAIEYAPDLILLDLDLPDIPGTEVLILLQAEEKTKEIPVIVISADAMPMKIELLMKAGARNYLTKPLDVAEFLKVMDKLIGNHKLQA
ncbi:MAG: PAS domain S-box protein [Bacteroidetes bacterium]|nr:PAS domain S-box protein [Bacteroidota bacterium]